MPEREWPKEMKFSTECPNCGNLDQGHDRGCTDPTPCVRRVEVIPADSLNVLSREEARLLVAIYDENATVHWVADLSGVIDRLSAYAMSTEREWGRYRPVQPEEIIDAFQYTGGFPLAFLQGDEAVRVSADPEYAIEIIDRATEESWICIRHGEYVVRFPQLGLRNYPAESFEYGFEEVDDDAPA